VSSKEKKQRKGVGWGEGSVFKEILQQKKIIIIMIFSSNVLTFFLVFLIMYFSFFTISTKAHISHSGMFRKYNIQINK
jgi:hypothetical protein